MADDIQLSTNVGIGDVLRADETATGEKVQYVKLMSGESASETLILVGAGTAANALRITIASDSPFALKAGTASVGTVGLNTGTNAIGSVKSAGAVAHDAVGTSILPVLQGAIAKEIDGTTPGLVAEDDISYGKCDREGRILVSEAHPYLFGASKDYGAAQTNVTVQAAVAAVSIFITDITLSNGAVAGNLTLLDGSGGTVLFEAYMAINSNLSVSLRTPIKLTVNTLLAFTSTSSTTHSVNVTGYYGV